MEFPFLTIGVRVRLMVTKDKLMPFVRLVSWASHTEHIGIIDRLAAECPVERINLNAALVYDVLKSFVLTEQTDGRRFLRIEHLREDPTISEIFGTVSAVGDDRVRRVFDSVEPMLRAEAVFRHAEPKRQALP